VTLKAVRRVVVYLIVCLLMSQCRLGAMGSLAGRIPQASMGIGLNRMRQIPRRPVQSFGGQFPAPFRDTGRGLMYSGRAQEGMRNRGLMGR